MVLVGQALRSAAMIHASTNFSHTVAFQKRNTHRLVTDGVYRLEVFLFFSSTCALTPSTAVDGFVIHHTLVSITGHLALNWCFKTR